MPHLNHMSVFSKRQQQVFGLCCLFYGIWLCAAIISEQGREVAASPLRQPDPPDMRMYLDAPINPNWADAQELQLLPSHLYLIQEAAKLKSCSRCRRT